MKYLGLLAAWGVFVVAMLLSLPMPAAAGGVIGSGPGTCTSAELNAKLAGGGQFIFNCGPGPVTIAITSTPFITRDTTLDGGGVITISGGTTEQVFAVEGAGLTLNNLTVADGYRLGDGGAIYVYDNARLTLVNTNFVGNHAQTVGGAILTAGQLTITGGLFYSNMANLSGGVIYNTGRAYIAGATFLSNTSGTGGGAIENAYLSVQSQMVIISSRLQGNISQGPGGAIHNLAGLVLEDDTLANNNAQGFTTGGGLADFGTSGDVYGSTFSGNNAFGGAGMVISDSQSFIHESTFSANLAGAGGGALVETGTVLVLSSTFYQNSASSGSAIARVGGTVDVLNSILAGNPGSNCSTALTSLGHNLEDGVDCNLNQGGDLQNTNPLLGPLADNGGPTETHALLPGSPAIKHGATGDCEGWDQRGYPRVGGCDIGAFQVVFRVLEPLVRR